MSSAFNTFQWLSRISRRTPPDWVIMKAMLCGQRGAGRANLLPQSCTQKDTSRLCNMHAD